MKEKELRLALVCYGGVSLAVYMHGVTKEILKLARASKTYHAIRTPEARGRLSYEQAADATPGESRDSERVYFELLKDIGRELDLRVVVDVIAGASAGGINAVILGRALAHDLPIDGLQDIWLKEADIDELLAPKRRARVWSKWYMRLVLWVLARGRLARVFWDGEVRTKLSTFLRSRWFKPPFDGANLAAVLFDAIDGMGNPKHAEDSLLPEGQRLDLFVTVTDFFGYPRQIPIHDPPFISEREHRHTLRFEARRWPGGDYASDFDRAGVPALIFAARATSSFPGAFPPVRLGEIERLLAARGLHWQERARFVERNFQGHLRAGLDPAKTSFIDGSVLNNKPFAEAIESIRGRAAYRQVDRRLVYVDPDPEQAPTVPDGRPPGFFRTLKGALSDIPRNEPIHNDLAWINGHNHRVRRLKIIIDAARPDIERLVTQISEGALDRQFTWEQLGGWRTAANALAVRQAGFVYDGYLRLKLTAVLEFLSDILCELRGVAVESEAGRQVTAALDRWARSRDVHPESACASGMTTVTGADGPAWMGFLLGFDVGYRQRRLRFVIRALNQIYPRLSEPSFGGVTTDRLDKLKADLYDALELLRQYDGADFVSARIKTRVGDLFDPERGDYVSDDILTDIDEILRDLAAEIDLASVNDVVDELFASLSPDDWSEAARSEFLVAYIGFAFWDVLTFSLTNWRELGEFDEIRVDRISPLDADSIRADGIGGRLKGVDFAHFGAFFSRRHRENDYLWGRLNAAERLIDILCNAAAVEGVGGDVDIRVFKKCAFESILRSEKERLTVSDDLIAGLEAAIARL